MKRKLYHPLWVHLPAVGMIVWFVVTSLRLPPLPAEVVGETGWRSQGLLSLLQFFPMVLNLAAGVLVDELWARSEKIKRFNWLTCFDEVVIAIYAHGFIMANAASGLPPFGAVSLGPLLAGALALAAGCAAAAYALEYIRPFSPRPQAEPAKFEATTELVDRISSGAPWTYRESQNPWWCSVVAVGVPIVMLADAAMAYRTMHSLPQAVAIALVGVLCFVLYGGFRVTVDCAALAVRVGIFGIKLMRLPLAEISSVETKEFFPLKDFGGWGIRLNREMKGFFLRGNVGVLITDIHGKKTLIGSDNPERLVAVIKAAMEA